MTLTVEPQHQRQMNTTQNNCNLPLNVRTATATKVGISPANVYCSPTNTLCMSKDDSMHAQQWPKGPACSSHHHPSAAWEKWWQRIPPLHFKHQGVMDAVTWHPFPCWNNRTMNGTRQSHWGRKLHSTVSMLWNSSTLCSSAEMVLCLTIPRQFEQQSMDDITAHSFRTDKAGSSP